MATVVDEYIARLQGLDARAERTLLNRILTGGFDQGCFIRPSPTVLLPDDPVEVKRLMDAIQNRERPPREEVADPFEYGRSQEPIDGDEPGFVVLSQRCDLLSTFALDPLVELAMARRVADRAEASTARRNSPRWLPLVEDEGGLWIVDLRLRAHLPKDKLIEFEPRQVVAEDDWDRFRLRLGQRYTRDALPDSLVDQLARPIGKVVLKRSNSELTECFTDFLVRFEVDDDGEQRPRLYAVIGENFSQRSGEEAYEKLEEQFGAAVTDGLHGDSGAIHVRQLHFLLWNTAMKLDFDAASWDAKIATPDAAEPTR